MPELTHQTQPATADELDGLEIAGLVYGAALLIVFLMSFLFGVFRLRTRQLLFAFMGGYVSRLRDEMAANPLKPETLEAVLLRSERLTHSESA